MDDTGCSFLSKEQTATPHGDRHRNQTQSSYVPSCYSIHHSAQRPTVHTHRRDWLALFHTTYVPSPTYPPLFTLYLKVRGLATVYTVVYRQEEGWYVS